MIQIYALKMIEFLKSFEGAKNLFFGRSLPPHGLDEIKRTKIDPYVLKSYIFIRFASLDFIV